MDAKETSISPSLREKSEAEKIMTLEDKYLFLRREKPDIFRRCCEIGWAISIEGGSLSSAAEMEAMAISLAFDLIEGVRL